MKILSVDSSGQTACAAIVDEYITLGEVSVNAQAKMTHSEILLPMIHQLFSLTGLTIDEVDYIACVNGPGSFTGLRIGAATALGLAKGAGKRVIPVPALDSLAYNVLACGAAIAPMMDARRSQVYTALYRYGSDHCPERVTEYQALPVSEALDQIPIFTGPGVPVVFTGDGADAYASEIKKRMPHAVFAPVSANRQRAASAGAYALRLLASGYVPGDELPLLYIRKPQAERNLLEKNAKTHE